MLYMASPLSLLPRIKNNEMIDVTDEDATKEAGREQPIYLMGGDISPVGYEPHQRHERKSVFADLHILRGKRTNPRCAPSAVLPCKRAPFCSPRARHLSGS
jgi:hypothetical protein